MVSEISTRQAGDLSYPSVTWRAMKISMTIDYSDDPRRAVERAQAMEAAGVDMAWVAEAYSYRSSNVLIKEDGAWRAVASHVSGVKSRAPAEQAE